MSIETLSASEWLAFCESCGEYWGDDGETVSGGASEYQMVSLVINSQWVFDSIGWLICDLCLHPHPDWNEDPYYQWPTVYLNAKYELYYE